MAPDKKYLTILVAAVAVGAVGYLAFKATRGPSRQVKPPVVDKVLEEDRANLTQDKGANEFQVYAALVRLSQAGDELAVKEGLKRATAPSEWVRAGAADALGRSADPAAVKLLVKLLDDQSLIVRLRALKALQYQNTDNNRQLLQNYLERKNLSDKEKIQVHFSLVRMVPFEERKKHVAGMVEIAQHQDHNDKIESWLEIVALAPREDVVLSALTKAVASGTDEDFEALAIRHLGASAPELIRTKMMSLHSDKRIKIRLSVVQSLATACPNERMGILTDSLEHEKESIVWRTAVQTAAMMPSEKTLALMKSIKAKKISDEDAHYVDDSIRMISAARGPDPCELRFPKTAPGEKSAHKSGLNDAAR